MQINIVITFLLLKAHFSHSLRGSAPTAMALEQDNLVIKGEQYTKASFSKKLRGRRVENLDTPDLIGIMQHSASHMSKVDMMNVAVDGSMFANNDYGGAYSAFLAMNQ